MKLIYFLGFFQSCYRELLKSWPYKLALNEYQGYLASKFPCDASKLISVTTLEEVAILYEL